MTGYEAYRGIKSYLAGDKSNGTKDNTGRVLKGVAEGAGH